MNMSNNQIEIICYVRKSKYFKSNTNSYVNSRLDRLTLYPFHCKIYIAILFF